MSKEFTIQSIIPLAAAIFAGLFFTITSANAGLIVVLNHSFEEGADGSSPGIDQPPWVRSTGDGTNHAIPIQELSGIPGQADPSPDGTDTIHYTNGPAESIYQVLAATLAANTTYTLKVDVGDRNDTMAQPGTINLGYVSDSPTSNNDYGLNLLAATVINDAVPVNTGASTTDGWQTWESTFTTGASPAGLDQALRIELVSNGGIQTLWDNVRLHAASGANRPSTVARIADTYPLEGKVGISRTWTSRSGRRVEARLVSAQGNQVVLATTQQKTVTVEFTRLVHVDQLYLLTPLPSVTGDGSGLSLYAGAYEIPGTRDLESGDEFEFAGSRFRAEQVRLEDNTLALELHSLRTKKMYGPIQPIAGAAIKVGGLRMEFR